MAASKVPELVTLDEREDLWDRCFTVAPLVIVGTREASGELDFAPKHLAMPISWDRYFGFVCSPKHATYRNALRNGEFTVTYLKADQVLLASLAAAPRCSDDSKPSLQALPSFPASEVDAAFVEEGYLFLECRLLRTLDDLGPNSLILGQVVRAHARKEYLRRVEEDDHEMIFCHPLPVYLHPGRYAEISRSFSFPFPDGFSR
ncbi:MAG: flavin reductase [Acidobacteria bacterium]|nr:flavin reductase [Acidobacteriota bacterium]